MLKGKRNMLNKIGFLLVRTIYFHLLQNMQKKNYNYSFYNYFIKDNTFSPEASKIWIEKKKKYHIAKKPIVQLLFAK